ncbi:hypothetical protein DEU35_1053 [Microbacterium sp. AG157]|uniref:hypothetical protein n=1 Tax=Microbacterium sp. AG157 TaxID=2183993 RepID=UPI000E21F287|nr:hypothetical protein [Microbacterium sp. AG157]RED00073.1 hypothetical protein DEU35_1053 [Microbacterium sp. AG157]
MATDCQFDSRTRDQGQEHGSGPLRATIGDDAAHFLAFGVDERAQRFSERHGFPPVGGTLLVPGTGLGRGADAARFDDVETHIRAARVERPIGRRSGAVGATVATFSSPAVLRPLDDPA